VAAEHPHRIGRLRDFWVDSGHTTIERGTNQQPNSSIWFQQGRALLRLTPAYVSGRMFAQAQMELVGNLCQATNPDLHERGHLHDRRPLRPIRRMERLGLKFGRFRAWEVYHFGMGMDP
jgi:hypothetical protein